MNLFDFALQMEQDATEFYLKLSNSTSEPGYKRFFADLASDHIERYRFIESMTSGEGTGDEKSFPVMDENCSPWRMVSIKDAVADEADGGLENAYRFALKLETAEIHCFRNMLEQTRSGKMKKYLKVIAEEETRHVEDFQSVYDFINAPNQYLAYGEFSNLSEFHQFGRDVD
jgi:rubrerythrin